MAGKNGEGPTAALFDVDGTLVDTNYLHSVTWWEAFRQAGYQVRMAEIHRAIGMGSDQLLDKLRRRGRSTVAPRSVVAEGFNKFRLTHPGPPLDADLPGPLD
jgi:beta-phosphoglucomutase-like phosphatase (HAD superfamily)